MDLELRPGCVARNNLVHCHRNSSIITKRCRACGCELIETVRAVGAIDVVMPAPCVAVVGAHQRTDLARSIICKAADGQVLRGASKIMGKASQA